MTVGLVSVIMPVHNAATTVGTAIDAVLRQTWKALELIVYDDASEDETRDRVLQRAEDDERIRLIAGPRRGIVGALQEGCRHARGTLLARMDGDDDLHPTRLERQLAALEADPDAALCGTGVAMFGERVGRGRRRYEHWLNRLTHHDAIRRELFVECPLAHPSFTMRRNAFEAVGGYEDHGWAEDYDLCMRMACGGYRFATVAAPLLRWRESAGRLSMNSDRYSPARFRALKRHYLFDLHPLEGRDFYQWGVGQVGKPWLREWDTPRPLAAVDIHPRKIGRTIHQTPVIAPEELPPPGTAFTVVAVGAPGARTEIRAWMNPRGYVEGRDYLFIA